ncbi:MAG: hypothetical protein Kow00121_29730 [Elainellaceae cyanobacterium]
MLPLTGFGIGLVTNWMIHHILSQASDANVQLQADTDSKVRLTLSPTIASIVASVDRDDQVTEVTFNVTNSSLKRLRFEFPGNELSQIETMLNQELGLQPETIRQLVRYSTEGNEFQLNHPQAHAVKLSRP